MRAFVLPGDPHARKPSAFPEVDVVEGALCDQRSVGRRVRETILRNRADQYDIPFSIVRFGSVLNPEEAGTIYRLSFLHGWVATQQQLGKHSTLWPMFDGQPDLAKVIDVVGDAPDDAAMGFLGRTGRGRSARSTSRSSWCRCRSPGGWR